MPFAPHPGRKPVRLRACPATRRVYRTLFAVQLVAPILLFLVIAWRLLTGAA